MPLPSDSYFPPRPRSWVNQPLVLVLRLALVLALAAGYDSYALVLAVRTAAYYSDRPGNLAFYAGLLVLGLAIVLQALLLWRLLVRRRYVLASVTLLSLPPLLYVSLICLL